MTSDEHLHSRVQRSKVEVMTWIGW